MLSHHHHTHDTYLQLMWIRAADHSQHAARSEGQITVISGEIIFNIGESRQKGQTNNPEIVTENSVMNSVWRLIDVEHYKGNVVVTLWFP